MAQMQLIQTVLAPQDVVNTPEWCAKDLIEFFAPSGVVLEPCRGKSAIYQFMPPGSPWCEVQEGRDFFAFTDQVTWIISNPPYSMLREFLEHGLSVSENVVYLLPVRKFFSSNKTVNMAMQKGWLKHIRFYGPGGSLGFPFGHPFGALHWARGWHGETSWSWYAPNNASTRPLVRAGKKSDSKSSALSVKQAGSPSGG